MTQTAIATIHISALTHNFQVIQQRMPNQKILPMIKGNAYGHGLVATAKALSDARAFGVANLYEAIQLRQGGISQDIVVMRGFCNEEELQAFHEDNRLIACIHDFYQIEQLKCFSKNKTSAMRIWLKADTGMHRLGFSGDDFFDRYLELSQLKNTIHSVSIFSHLADADGDNPLFTENQINRFKQITKNINVEKSILNSAGIIAFPQFAHEWIRPGILLYGASPFQKNSIHYKSFNEIKPVMTLRSQIISVKTVLKNEVIGYSCTFKAEKTMRVAVVGIGYADGYPRHAKSGTPVLIHGKKCPLVGRVSMDMITVDISQLPTAIVGDEVILWGSDLQIVEIAEYANSIAHELLTSITARVQMTYI